MEKDKKILLLKLLKKILKAIIIIIGALMATIISIIVITELQLNSFTSQLVNSVPDNSALISQDSHITGYDIRNDGTCYVSVILIKSDLSPERLTEYYNNYNFKFAQAYLRGFPFGFCSQEVQCIVEKAESLPYEVPLIYEIKFFENTKVEANDFSNLYLITILDVIN